MHKIYKKTTISKIGILITVIIIILTTYSNIYGEKCIQGKKITNLPDKPNYHEYFKTYDKIHEIINDIKESDLREYMTTITTTYKGRVTGSEICREAGEWIFNEFSKMSNINVRNIPWSARADFFHLFKIHNCCNIEAELPGYSNDSLVFIFSAHYDCDHKESQGALDNGAGIAALLAVANALSKFEFKHTIKFIAFSGEEVNFLGSYEYAKESYYNGENIVAVLNADVIGNNTYSSNNPHLLRAFTSHPTKWIVDILDNTCVNYNIGIDVKEYCYIGNSDDKPFDDYGYGAMQFFQSGNKMEEYYGTPLDTIGLINFSYLINVTKCIAAGLAILADLSNISPRVNIIFPSEDSLYILNGLNIIDLKKGKTFVIGSIIIQAEVLSEYYEINKVVFELIKGDNEHINCNEVRPIIANFSDYSYPYEWKLTERCYGWNTIRVIAFDEEDNFSSDEIEIWFFNI